MKKPKSIHFVGIKGVGMTPLAIIAKEAGIAVSGSDIGEEFITDVPLKKAGIVPFVGFSKANVGNAALVITTGAHGGFNNPEVVFAKEKGIPVLTQGEAVGVFMEGEIFNKRYEGISVAGSHGKTTTTAMIATMLKENKLDPTFIIGTSVVSSLGTSGHFGKGKYFVAEADEYATEPAFDKTPKLLWQHPKIAIITNIELDHPDLYASAEEIKNVFLKFIKQLPKDGKVIACGDDPLVEELLNEYNGEKITYGFSPVNTYVLKNVHVTDYQTFFWVACNGTEIGDFTIQVPGEHNALNALATIVVGLSCGLSLDAIKKSLVLFTGSKRRAEYIGKMVSGAMLFDDYAHHPTEIKKTLHTFRQRFPKKRIICIFQPHTYSRTKQFFDEFTKCFGDADKIILTDIYPSLREKPDSSISSQKLTQSVNNFHKDAVCFSKLTDVIEYIQAENPGENTVVISMGAGDVYKIHTQLTN